MIQIGKKILSKEIKLEEKEILKEEIRFLRILALFG